jgi:hypothetical protein
LEGWWPLKDVERRRRKSEEEDGGDVDRCIDIPVPRFFMSMAFTVGALQYGMVSMWRIGRVGIGLGGRVGVDWRNVVGFFSLGMFERN